MPIQSINTIKTKKSFGVNKKRIANIRIAKSNKKIGYKMYGFRLIEKKINKVTSVEKIDYVTPVLSQGIPTYSRGLGQREGVLLKTYPDGRKELVTLDDNFKEIKLKSL